jgi:hypothetical protein
MLIVAAIWIPRLMQSDRFRPTRIPAVLAPDPPTAFNCGNYHRLIGPEPSVVKPLRHRITMLDRVERGFCNFVVALKPERPSGRFALAAAPAPIGQRKTLLITWHVHKIALLEAQSRHKPKP